MCSVQPVQANPRTPSKPCPLCSCRHNGSVAGGGGGCVCVCGRGRAGVGPRAGLRLISLTAPNSAASPLYDPTPLGEQAGKGSGRGE